MQLTNYLPLQEQQARLRHRTSPLLLLPVVPARFASPEHPEETA